MGKLFLGNTIYQKSEKEAYVLMLNTRCFKDNSMNKKTQFNYETPDNTDEKS